MNPMCLEWLTMTFFCQEILIIYEFNREEEFLIERKDFIDSRNKICMEKNYANDCMHISVNDIDMEGFHFFYDGTWMGGKTNLNKNIRTLFRRKVSILILNPLNKRWNDFFVFFEFSQSSQMLFFIKNSPFQFCIRFFWKNQI